MYIVGDFMRISCKEVPFMLREEDGSTINLELVVLKDGVLLGCIDLVDTDAGYAHQLVERTNPETGKKEVLLRVINGPFTLYWKTPY
jgi:hypothetical protein